LFGFGKNKKIKKGGRSTTIEEFQGVKPSVREKSGYQPRITDD
jgi:hypothetical protein